MKRTPRGLLIGKDVDMVETLSLIASGVIALGGMIVMWLVGTAK
jgi:hypothetical protein